MRIAMIDRLYVHVMELAARRSPKARCCGALAAARLSRAGTLALDAVCAAPFLAGAAIARFHIGNEQGWWRGMA